MFTFFLHSTKVESVMTQLDDLGAYNVPVFLEEKRVDAIRARGFLVFKEEENLLDFLRSGDEVKKIVILKVYGPFERGVFWNLMLDV